MEIYRISILLLLLPRHTLAITLTGPPYAVLDQTYQFTCNVTGSATSQTLTFRKDGGSTCTIAFPLDPTKCQQFTNTPGYSCSCGQNGVYYMDISSVNLTDEDIWYCQLSVQTSNSISLAVYYGPDTNQVRVTKTPDVVAIENHDITLTCETLTSVSPSVTFTWEYSDASAISGGSTGTVTGSLGSTWLQTRTFQPIRSKTNVRCTVGNTRTGVTASGELSLDVKWPPPGNPSISSFQSVMYSGEQRTIQCTVTGGNPLADITWSCYNTSTTGTESGSKTSSLTFLVTKQQNGQQCQCRATWIHGGYDKTDAETFNVYYAPSITFSPVVISEGNTLTLTCKAHGRPQSYTFGHFTQYWGTEAVDTQIGEKTTEEYTWSKQKASYLDTGVYECSVGNGISDRHGVSVQRKRVSVHVRASPKFTPDASQMIGADIGSAVRLSQTFYNSNLNYTSVNWTFVKLNSVINESANVRRSNVTLKKNDKSFKFEGFVASVIITNFREQDIGVYKVTVCNSIGCNSSNVNLTAAGPPLVPLDFSITNTTQTSISLRWKPNFPGGDFTQVFILHYRLQGSGDWQTQEYEDNPVGYVYADITDLQPGSVYEFRVRARNNRRENNEGNFTKIIQKTTETLPTNEEPNSSIGVGLGIGLGICLLIIIGLVITLIYFYRRIKLSSQSTRKDHQPDNQGTGGPLGNGGFISGQSHSQDQPDYAHLEQRSPEQYEQIRLYENTKGKSKYSNENLQESSPATTYEKVDPHIYVNRENDPRDPTYINRPKV